MNNYFKFSIICDLIFILCVATLTDIFANDMNIVIGMSIALCVYTIIISIKVIVLSIKLNKDISLNK